MEFVAIYQSGIDTEEFLKRFYELGKQIKSLQENMHASNSYSMISGENIKKRLFSRLST